MNKQSMGINADKAAKSLPASAPKAAPTAGGVTAPGVSDLALWHQCQRLAWPKMRGAPSNGMPYPQDECGPIWRPASWLYHTLAGDPALRAQVLP